MALRLDSLDRENQGPINQQILILCEGKGDASFFRELTRHRNLSGFQIGFPDEQTSGAYGIDGFSRYLESLRVRNGFYSPLRAIIIVADNDLDPSKQFSRVLKQIRKAANHHPYPLPSLPEQIVGSDLQKIAVLMMPKANEKGALETLLLEATSELKDLHQCLEKYCECAGTKAWNNITKLSKMRLNALIAASCSDNPACNVTNIWKQKKNPIALGHKCFDHIESFLKKVLVES